MKKLLALFIAVIFISMTFAACDLSEDEIAEKNNKDKEENGKVKEYSKSDIPESSDGLTFSINSDGKSYTLTGMGTCTKNEIIIGTYNKLPVTKIGHSAFKNYNSRKKVFICESVQYIDDWAFADFKGLTNVTFADNSKLLSIGVAAFYGCNELKEIILPGKLNFIGDSAFSACSSLRTINIPDSVIQIGDGAFSSCTKLADIDMSDSVSNIGENILFDTEYYNNVTNWENGSLYIGVHLIACDLDYSTTAKKFLIKEGTKTIADSALYGYYELTTITIPRSIVRIGKYSFRNFDQLKTIHFQGSVFEWSAIEKDYKWNDGTGNYTVRCTDGDIAKADDN